MKLIYEGCYEEHRDSLWQRLSFNVQHDIVEMDHLDRQTGKKYHSFTRLGSEGFDGKREILFQKIYEMEC